MRKYLAIALLIGLAYGEVSVAEAHQQVSDGGNTATRTQTDKRGTNASPLEVNEHAIQSDAEAAEEASKDAEQHRVNRWNIGLAFAIAICAGLQFLGILGQIYVYLKQTKIMQETLGTINTQSGHMANQLAEMKRQADTMQQQANAALAQIEAMKNRERARLVILPKPIEGFDANDFMFGQLLELNVDNVGYSHAFDVSVEGHCEITANQIPPASGEMSRSTVGIVQAGREKAKTHISINATDEMWDNVIKPGTKNLYVHLWGVVRYKDVFGDGQTADFRYFNWIQSVGEATQVYGRMMYTVVSLFGWEAERQPAEQDQSQNPN